MGNCVNVATSFPPPCYSPHAPMLYCSTLSSHGQRQDDSQGVCPALRRGDGMDNLRSLAATFCSESQRGCSMESTKMDLTQFTNPDFVRAETAATDKMAADLTDWPQASDPGRLKSAPIMTPGSATPVTMPELTAPVTMLTSRVSVTMPTFVASVPM